MKRVIALTMLFLGLAAVPLHAQSLPDICNKKKSCFMAFNGNQRSFCEAYVEGKSCFMALGGQARTACEANRTA